MKEPIRIAALSACMMCIVVARPANGQTVVPTPAVPPQGAGVAPPTISYRPPLRGAPAARVDGASRGSGVSLIDLLVLAPDHTGLTTQEQPTLYWYQSEPAEVPFELTVIVDKKPKPVLHVERPRVTQAGIQKLRLADHGVKLVPGTEYQWVVTLIPDVDSRSKDVVASGFIRRVEPPSSLSGRLAHASSRDRPAIYAEEGIWYDAFEALSSLIDRSPGDPSLLAERSALLNQVGLAKAATATNVKTPPASP